MSVNVAVWVRLPETPVTVIVAAPTAAEPEAVSVKTLLVAVLLGLKEAVTPAGSPLADKLTALLKLPMSVTATVVDPLAP